MPNRIINSLVDGDMETANEAFDSLIRDKVVSMLEVSKVEIASDIMNDLQNEEILDEGGPTRKHFQQVADLLKNIPDIEKRKELAKHHAGVFKSQNPRFDHARFYKAAGIDDINEATNREMNTRLNLLEKLMQKKMTSLEKKHPDKSVSKLINEALEPGATPVNTAQVNRNVLTNIRRAVQALRVQGVNPVQAAAGHRDFGKLVSKNPKTPGYMLLRKLSPQKATAVQSLTQAGVPLGSALESNPNEFNQAIQKIKRFK